MAMKEPFSIALRAEIEGLVLRYEALVSQRLEMAEFLGSKQTEESRAALATLQKERDAFAEETRLLRAERDTLKDKLDDALARMETLEAEARAGAAAASALEEQFATERRFVEAASAVAGTLLEGALELAFGRKMDASPAAYAALKGKGLEAILIAAFKERGRNVAHAPLLDREKNQLPALATAASCELVTPTHGTRFSSSLMEKVATMSDPAEEGNVVECLLPGLRRAGTEGSLLFPRVKVATG